MSRTRRGRRRPTVEQQQRALFRAAGSEGREAIREVRAEADRARAEVEAQLQEAHAGARRREEEAQLQTDYEQLRRVAQADRQDGSWDYREAQTQAQNNIRRDEQTGQYSVHLDYEQLRRVAQADLEQSQEAAPEDHIYYIILIGSDGQTAASRTRRDYESPPPFFLLNPDGCEGVAGLRNRDYWLDTRIFGFSHKTENMHHYLEIEIAQGERLPSTERPPPAESLPFVKRVLEL